INNPSALPWYLVSRPVSRQSHLRTLILPRKTGGFAAEVVGFELGMPEILTPLWRQDYGL
ncbi:MAG: hypothetical protein ACK6AT_02375, partial [Planctomycetota bacterium]